MTRTGYPISSVDNALRLLVLFREKRPVRVSEAAASLGVARSTAHRLLTTLEQHGFARRDPATRSYLPGPALFELGLATAGVDVRHAVRPQLERLVAEVDETSHLVVLEGAAVLFLDSVECSKALRIASRVGAVMPAHCTSAGKALLAEFDPEALAGLYAGRPLEQMTARSITSWDALERELATVRERGYATNRDESENGVTAVAAAIPGLGRPAAFSISGPTSRLGVDQLPGLGAAVERAARAARPR